MPESNLILLVAIAVPSLFLSLLHGSAWEKDNPEKLGFKWGYFVIYNTLIGNTIISGSFAWIGIDQAEAVLLFLGIVMLVISAGIAYFSIIRIRWALVVSTILSLNPLWMVINIFYLKNRWHEFKSESSKGDRGFSLEKFKALPRDVRIALFVAIVWVVCVPYFTFLFKPYGRYMRDDDLLHMFGVIVLPIVIWLALFHLFRRYVR
jgi:hypothetical protein